MPPTPKFETGTGNEPARKPAPAAIRLWKPAPAATRASGEEQSREWRIKTYYAPNMQAAMLQARDELGSDATIISSRPAPPERRHLGEIEAVFGLVPNSATSSEPTPKKRPSPAAVQGANPASRSPATPAGPTEPQIHSRRDDADWEGLTSHLTDVRRQLQAIQRMLAANNAHPAESAPATTAYWDIYCGRLLESGLDKDLIWDVLRQADQRLADDPAANDVAWPEAIAAELKCRFTVDASIGLPGRTASAILIGPPGAGKTTTLVKLAVQQGLMKRRPVRLICLDQQRIAASRQLEAYAAILGARFTSLATVEGLEKALAAAGPEMVFVDTAGSDGSGSDTGEELANWLSGKPEIDVHLVLPASMRDRDLSRIIDRFALFSPHKLLFTKLDETASPGALVTESARTGKPISFLSAGRQIPDDIDPADPARIVQMLLRTETVREER